MSLATSSSGILTGESPAVLDALGMPILKGSIVGMSDPQGPWSLFQGLVVSPYSDIEGEKYTVPVFFNAEVCYSHFQTYRAQGSGIPGVRDWDKEHLASCKRGEVEFLFEEGVWQQCPRVLFFKPEELVVCDRWKLDTLCQRLFKNLWHSLCVPPPPFDGLPQMYLCWMEGCMSQATQTALCNAQGQVAPFCVCDICHARVNGLLVDWFPESKNPILLADGNPVRHLAAAA